MCVLQTLYYIPRLQVSGGTLRDFDWSPATEASYLVPMRLNLLFLRPDRLYFLE